MTVSLRSALRGSGLVALALAAASCGGDDPAKGGQDATFSLLGNAHPVAWPGGNAGFSERDDFGDALPPLPQAAPMAREASRATYRVAPDYGYAANEPVYYDRTAGDNSYAWLALASSLGGVLGDAPPDYYFDYDGVEPWVWETGDHFVRYAEPIDDGYRYYYYSPGRDRPFLVSDPYYSYGYYGGRVVTIYDRDGRVLDGHRSWRQREAGERYYDRAEALYQASRRGQRHGVAAPDWAQRRDLVISEQRQWDRARATRAGWRNWDQRHDRAVAPHWAGERVARQYAAQRFAGWRQQDYRGPAPRFYAEAERSPELRQAVLRQQERRGRTPADWQRRTAIAQSGDTAREFARRGDERPQPGPSSRFAAGVRVEDRMQATDRGQQQRFLAERMQRPEQFRQRGEALRSRGLQQAGPAREQARWRGRGLSDLQTAQERRGMAMERAQGARLGLRSEGRIQQQVRAYPSSPRRQDAGVERRQAWSQSGIQHGFRAQQQAMGQPRAQPRQDFRASPQMRMQSPGRSQFAGQPQARPQQQLRFESHGGGGRPAGGPPPAMGNGQRHDGGGGGRRMP